MDICPRLPGAHLPTRGHSRPWRCAWARRLSGICLPVGYWEDLGHWQLYPGEAGSSTPERIAQIELDRGGGTQGSNQNLSYQITTSAQLNGSASVALARSSGTNFQWSPAKGATGLTWQSEGLADPGGPPGHPEYQVFTGVLVTGQTSGHGSVIFAEVGSNTPEATTQVTLMLGQ